MEIDMNSILKAMIISSGLIFTTISAHAAEITGTYDTWAKMKSQGWHSSDDFDDNKMHNALKWSGEVINQYPWTKYAFLRKMPGSPLFLADKNKKTLTYLSYKPRSGDYSDISIIYQGEDEGKGCYVSIVDTGKALEFEQSRYSMLSDEPQQSVRTKIIMVLPERCIDKQQLSSIKAKQRQEEQELQQWVGKQSLKELCQKTGNC
jgi:hypothetical protein